VGSGSLGRLSQWGGALLAAGCTQLRVGPAGVPNFAPDDVRIDQAYVGRTERVARASGVDVVWINPPSKRASQSN